MRLVDLLVLYAVIGAAAAAAIYVRAAPRDGRAVASAVLAVPLWPLWAPVALTARGASPHLARTRIPHQIEGALAEALVAVEGTPLSNLLSPAAVTGILSEVARVVNRSAELDALLRRPDLDPVAAERHVATLEAQGAPPRVLASARLHRENIQRLERLRDRDRRALAELTDLAGALRTQMVLARYAGSSAEGASGIVSELWARVEGLGAAIELSEIGDPNGVEAYPGR
ncbi:MAG: hypothetical protein JW751_10430 [Polyangiaceae bacterium]|nr:hypothetical protein [Polyangiaceae bacterium]